MLELRVTQRTEDTAKLSSESSRRQLKICLGPDLIDAARAVQVLVRHSVHVHQLLLAATGPDGDLEVLVDAHFADASQLRRVCGSLSRLYCVRELRDVSAGSGSTPAVLPRLISE